MRVLAGIYKSKKIETINNADTRPMMSKVREAIFNSIQFMVEEKDVLDLYSGSGSLGIEALSRGANYVTFVELSKECISILKKNVENMSSNLSIVNSPVNSFIENSLGLPLVEETGGNLALDIDFYDFNNDGMIDIILNMVGEGYNSSSIEIYINNGETFINETSDSVSYTHLTLPNE